MYTHPASPDCARKRRVAVPTTTRLPFSANLLFFHANAHFPSSSIDKLHDLPHLDQKEC
jgi:hypothetical protein